MAFLPMVPMEVGLREVKGTVVVAVPARKVVPPALTPNSPIATRSILENESYL
jgi:hypothetical protein